MDNLTTALEALAASAGTDARKDHRLEVVVDRDTDAVLRALARELAGTGDPKMYRSKAARVLIREGAMAIRAKRAREAARTVTAGK